MANFLPFLLTFILAFSANTKATSLVAKDQVPCTMCAECENPCQPLPPPPPQVIECPPPPSLPPPPPPLPPAIVECPPPPRPPKSPCPNNCDLPPPMTPYPQQSYFPPGTPFSYYVPPDYYNHDKNNGETMMPFQSILFSNRNSHSIYSMIHCLISLVFLCLIPYCIL